MCVHVTVLVEFAHCSQTVNKNIHAMRAFAYRIKLTLAIQSMSLSLYRRVESIPMGHIQYESYCVCVLTCGAVGVILVCCTNVCVRCVMLEVDQSPMMMIIIIKAKRECVKTLARTQRQKIHNVKKQR